LITNLRLVPELKMTDTIGRVGPHTKSYKFMDEHY
jgi:hypothetical protein